MSCLLRNGNFDEIKSSQSFAKLYNALKIGALPRLTIFDMEAANLNDAALCGLAQICAGGALACVTRLHLKGNRIGDTGLKSLADACTTSRALPALEELILCDNRCGDEGMIALGAACRAGALPRLSKFHFTANFVGATGVEALAAACVSGALAVLRDINFSRNKYVRGGFTTLAECTAATSDGSAPLRQLTHLGAADCRVDDAGMLALADACIRGRLPRLELINLQFNDVGNVGLDALAAAIGDGALGSLNSLYVKGGEHTAEGRTSLVEACRGRRIRGSCGAGPAYTFADHKWNKPATGDSSRRYNYK
jgi:Ran GTPase-activating protein (RanGAP) involved in mRNA processing and transport